MRALAKASSFLAVVLALSTFVNRASAQLLADNAEVAGFVSATGQVDTYRFNVNAGEGVVLRAASSQFQPQLIVTNPAGTQIASAIVNAARPPSRFNRSSSSTILPARCSRRSW